MIPDKLDKLGADYVEKILIHTDEPWKLNQFLAKRSIALTNGGGERKRPNKLFARGLMDDLAKLGLKVTFIVTEAAE